MKNITAVLCLLICCAPFTSMAHPGHGTTDGYTITHYFTEPQHAVVAVGILVACLLFIFQMHAKKHAGGNS